MLGENRRLGRAQNTGGITMTLVRWEPFGEINALRKEMNDFFGGLEPARSRAASLPMRMALDVAETDEEIIVKAELPGLVDKDIDVTVEGDILTIQAEKQAEANEEGKRYHLVERSYGKIGRSFRLPTDVEAGKTKATFKDGILTVALPKSESEKARKISVN